MVILNNVQSISKLGHSIIQNHIHLCYSGEGSYGSLQKAWRITNSTDYALKKWSYKAYQIERNKMYWMRFGYSPPFERLLTKQHLLMKAQIYSHNRCSITSSYSTPQVLVLLWNILIMEISITRSVSTTNENPSWTRQMSGIFSNLFSKTSPLRLSED